jgi:hypothetical protein
MDVLCEALLVDLKERFRQAIEAKHDSDERVQGVIDALDQVRVPCHFLRISTSISSSL